MTVTTVHPENDLQHRQRCGWVGVDIGTSTIKLAQVERYHGRWQLRFGQILPRPPHEWDPSLTGLRDILHTTLQGSHRWRSRPAACLLPTPLSELRVLDLPSAPDPELLHLVDAELNYADDRAPGDYQAGFWRTNPCRSHQANCLVHVISTPTDAAQTAASELNRAKLQCQAIDTHPFAAARAIAMAPPTTSAEIIVAVDWGFDAIWLTIVRHGTPCFTRLLSGCGLRKVVANLQTGLKLTHEEACQLLGKYGLQTDDDMAAGEIQKTICNLTKEPVKQAMQELQRTLQFIAYEHPELTPQHACLLGGGAALKGTDQLLAQQLALPTTAWSLSTQATSAATPFGHQAVLGKAIALSAIPLMA